VGPKERLVESYNKIAVFVMASTSTEASRISRKSSIPRPLVHSIFLVACWRNLGGVIRGKAAADEVVVVLYRRETHVGLDVALQLGGRVCVGAREKSGEEEKE
jgi:hypothetical protein